MRQQQGILGSMLDFVWGDVACITLNLDSAMKSLQHSVYLGNDIIALLDRLNPFHSEKLASINLGCTIWSIPLSSLATSGATSISLLH